MVRETRHLWVGNLPENVREEKIIEHFKRFLNFSSDCCECYRAVLSGTTRFFPKTGSF